MGRFKHGCLIGRRFEGCPRISRPIWAPIDEAATYTIVTNNYVRGGGDGYATFAEGDNAYDFGPPLEEVVADYIAKQGGSYTPYTDGRITEIK